MSNSRELTNEDSNKRKRQDSDNSAGNLCPSSIAASPPKFISVEDLMKAAVGLDKMALVHEISVDPHFKLEKLPGVESEVEENLSPTTSPIKNFQDLEHTVKRIVNKAFWDSLHSDLQENPPNFERALILLEEIKQLILSLLLPHHDKLKSEIEEHIDLQLVKQKCETNCLDFVPLVHYILTVMAKLCAPVRDDAIEQLRSCTDIVKLFKVWLVVVQQFFPWISTKFLFRSVLDILNDMKLDMANYAITSLRPVMQQHGIEYEKLKFNEYLKVNPEGLSRTKEWLRSSLKDPSNHVISGCASNSSPVDSPMTSKRVNLHADIQPTNPSRFDNILVDACWNLLEWPDENYCHLPETFAIDELRIRQMRDNCLQLILVAATTITVVNFGGQDFVGANSFKSELKDKLLILMSDVQQKNTAEILSIVSEQACALFENYTNNISSVKKNFEPGKRELLGSQVVNLCDVSNPVRKVIRSRVKNFMTSAYNRRPDQSVEIPAGLSLVSKELAHLTGSFLRLVSHNAQVFSEHYNKILGDLFDELSCDSAYSN